MGVHLMPEDDILSSYWLADLGSPDMRSAVGPFFLMPVCILVS